MARTQAAIGYGVFLKKGDGGSPTEIFTDLGVEITKIDPPGYTRSSEDATHMQSPDRFHEMIFGMFTSTPISIELNYVPAVADAVLAALLGDPGNWQIGNADWSVAFTVNGAFTEYKPTSPIDGKMTATATLTTSGKPTQTAV